VKLTGAGERALGYTLGAVLTPEHADHVLRATVLAWLCTPLREPFRIERALDLVRREGEAVAGDEGPALTVAICTRDRPRQLQTALAALLPALGALDVVLVVQNAPAAGEAPAHTPHPRVRTLVEPRPGLDWARNRALIECESDVILFMDDDCLPDANWVTAMRSLFRRNPDVDVATGLVAPLELATPAQELFEEYRGFPHGSLRRWTTAPRRTSVARDVGNLGRYGAGASLGLRRRLIDRIGPFDAALGAGTITRGGDELELFFRTFKATGLVAYEPRAMVRHAHRREMLELEGQLEGWSHGYSCAIERSVLAFPEERSAFRVLRARIAFLHHARRAVLQPRFRKLALAELRGLSRADASYARARGDAEDIAKRIESPAPDSTPATTRALNLAVRDGLGRTASAVIDVDQQVAALQLQPDIDLVTVDVVLHGRRLGAIDLPACAGAVGADRILDAIVDRMGSQLVGRPWGEAVAATRSLLVRAVSVGR